ncbi:LysR family transcriptional regulator [Microbacterium halophytorum]|uniref:LysR substrate-binding domain-containing protein n=1 Tax=Microbacterium halophytorum TaxID=2067568 RepID=UPI000CFCAF2A|nr:LysR substrate-binding domain-containing protein [Microbacterium halophytorum]
MELRQLRYFARVAETLHFGRAAQKEYVTQSVISTQIASLEKELGFRLFDRTSHRVSLTPAGEAFLKDVEQTLSALGTAVSQARNIAMGPNRRLRVGVFGEGAGPLTHLILSAFRAEGASADIQFVELSMVNQRTALIDGDVDVALLRLPITDDRLDVFPLFAEPRVAAIPADDELADAPELSVLDLLDRPFAVAADGTPADWRSYWSFDLQRGEHSRVGGEVRSVQESLATIAYGKAVDTFPSTAAAMFTHPGVRYVALADAEPSSLALVYLARRASDRTVEQFRSVAAQIVSQHLSLVPGAVSLIRPEK